MQKLPDLTQTAVRDLAWAVFAPNLIDDFHGLAGTDAPDTWNPVLTPERSEWLLRLDRDPSGLFRYLRRLKSTRLGIYFEALWQFFIECDPALELLAANLPVHDGSRTLGEFDLVYFDRTLQSWNHLELATKYYLDTGVLRGADTPTDRYSNWLGPSTRDRLDIKLQRLLSHQTRLSGLPLGRRRLEQLGVAEVSRRLVLKGCLFYRHPDNAPSLDAPDLSGDHRHGHWLPFTELPQLNPESGHWHILERPRWISAAWIPLDQADEQVKTQAAMMDWLRGHFAAPGARPLMLCLLREGGNGFVESARYMVTGPGWPG